MTPRNKLLELLNLLVLGTLFICASLLIVAASTWQARSHLHQQRMVETGSLYFDMRQHAPYLKVQWANHDDKKKNNFTCVQGERIRGLLRVHNYTSFIIESSLNPRPVRQGVNLAYRLRKRGESTYLDFQPRFLLHKPLRPALNKSSPWSQDEAIEILCPDEPGDYDLVCEFVQESVAWQQDVGGEQRVAVANLKVQKLTELREPPRSEFFNPPTLDIPRSFRLRKSESDLLLRTYLLAQRTLLANVSQFKVEDRTYIAFDAGVSYPMVWARDMATIQRALVYLRPNKKLLENHWSDLFLYRQKSDGELFDWVAPARQVQGASFGKNTIQSDQELWVVIAAMEALERGWILRRDFLRPLVADKHRIAALGEAMGWLLDHRWNDEHGCLISGHVADWGDVGLVGADGETATKIESGHPLVCGIFLQALLYQALSKLQRNFPKEADAIPKVETLGGTKSVLAKLRKFASVLWNKELGFFKVHEHVEPSGHAFDENQIFALGGNVLAIESGIASPVQRERILANAVNRQKEFKVSSIAAVLTPAYPPGTFEHPDMNEVYEYQNGGQWDWFGARAVKLLLRQNRSLGMTKLLEIARKVARSGGFFEWDTLQGISRGSRHYRAGAAAFIEAVHQGVLGEL